MDIILAVILGFWGEIAPKLAVLAALIILDVALGVALAIRRSEFRWTELGRFYYSMVLPLLLGWLAFALVSQWVTGELAAQLGPEWVGIVGDGITTFAWLAAVGQIGSSILSNGEALYGEGFGPRAAARERD